MGADGIQQEPGPDGREAKMSYGAHVLMESRNGLVVNPRVTSATGACEREASIEMVDDIPGQERVTLGTDKNYDTKDHVRNCAIGM